VKKKTNHHIYTGSIPNPYDHFKKLTFCLFQIYVAQFHLFYWKWIWNSFSRWAKNVEI